MMKRMIGGLLVALACTALMPAVGSVVPLPTVSNVTSQGPPPLKLNYYRTPKRGPWCANACDGVGPCCPLPPPGGDDG